MRTAEVDETWAPPPARVGPLALFTRGGASLALSTLAWLAWLLLRVLTAPSRRARRAARGWVYRLWARGLLAAVGVTVETRGSPPSEPCVLVSNHLSYLDVLVLGGSWNCTFVAKAEIADWPYCGLLARSMGTIFVDRARVREIPRVNAAIGDALEAGVGVVLFAEGRSTRGRTVEPFRSALLEAAAAQGRPVAWAALTYAAPPGGAPADQAVCFWGEAGFTRHLGAFLRQPRGYRARVTFGSERIPAADRKTLARELHARVSSAFEPVVGRGENGENGENGGDGGDERCAR